MSLGRPLVPNLTLVTETVPTRPKNSVKTRETSHRDEMCNHL